MYRCFFVLGVCILMVTPALGGEGGKLTITARASIYNPPGDADTAPMVNIDAAYRLSSMVSVVGSGGWTSYSASGTDITFIPLSVTGRVHFLGVSTFDPYAGAGLAMNLRSYDYPAPLDDETDVTGGMEILGGVSYRPGGGFGVDFDIKYRIEDLSDMGDSGSWSLGGGVTGSVSLDL